MSGVWLLLGPEEGEKSVFLKATIAAATKASGGEPDVHRAYPYDTNIVDLVARLRTGALFAAHRVLILGEVDAIRSQSDVAVLADYCADPAPDATLVLQSAELPGKIPSRLVRAVPKERQKIFWEMFENRQVDWVRTFFRKQGIAADGDVITFILDMVGGITQDLQQECGRLAQYFGEGARLRLEEVEGYLYHSREENVFTLFERLASRDAAGALEVLEKVLLSRQADPIAILAGLLWQVRTLHNLSAMTDEGFPPAEAFTRLKVRGKRQQRIYQEARGHYTTAEIEGLVVLIADTDRAVRTNRAELHRVLLQLLVFRATLGSRRLETRPRRLEMSPRGPREAAPGPTP